MYAVLLLTIAIVAIAAMTLLGFAYVAPFMHSDHVALQQRLNVKVEGEEKKIRRDQTV